MAKSRIAKQNPAIANVGALLDLFFAAEPENFCASTACEFHAGRIVGIQHREITRLLILEDARLGVGVGREGAVAVKVIGSDVKHYRDLWTK